MDFQSGTPPSHWQNKAIEGPEVQKAPGTQEDYFFKEKKELFFIKVIIAKKKNRIIFVNVMHKTS